LFVLPAVIKAAGGLEYESSYNTGGAVLPMEVVVFCMSQM
jgi:hypothetical protein